MSTWTMHHYMYIHTQYMHTYISTVMMSYTYDFILAHSNYGYSGTSENGLPILWKPPQCRQKAVFPNHSL